MVAIMAGLGGSFGGGWRVGVQLYMDLAGACILALCRCALSVSRLLLWILSVSLSHKVADERWTQRLKVNPVVRA